MPRRALSQLPSGMTLTPATASSALFSAATGFCFRPGRAECGRHGLSIQRTFRGAIQCIDHGGDMLGCRAAAPANDGGPASRA
jgi:hypothetical protein